jgi:hypothetical protein
VVRQVVTPVTASGADLFARQAIRGQVRVFPLVVERAEEKRANRLG